MGCKKRLSLVERGYLHDIWLPKSEDKSSLSWFIKRVYKEDQKRINKLIEDAMVAKVSNLEMEYRFLDHQGNIHDVIDRSYLMYKDGRLVRFVGAMLDITKQKQDEERIVNLSELRNKYIQLISHMLRTPLTSVNWNIEQLLGGKFGELRETQKDFLEATLVESKKIVERISDILISIDIAEDKAEFARDEVSLLSIVKGEVANLTNACQLKGVQLVVAKRITEVRVVKCDTDKTRLCVRVLLENALLYTKKGGKIKVRTTNNGKVARFEVIDTGIGIPEGEQKNIFNRFFRASNAMLEATDYFGLGLSMAKKIIEKQGGKIGFNSKEGQGSTFWFELPNAYK